MKIFQMLSRPNSNARRLLLVGNWRWDIYEEALAEGFRANSWRVEPFKIRNYLSYRLLDRIQLRLKNGPSIFRLNRQFLKKFSQKKPCTVLLYSTDVIFPSTLKKAKTISPKTVLISYHNDNPFVGFKNRIKWRHYLKSLSITDITLVYRPSNIADAYSFGAKRVDVLPPYFISYRHKPVFNRIVRDICDVIYIGHYEPDGRAEIIDYLIRNGIHVKIYGTGWEGVSHKYPWVKPMDIHPIYGEAYVRELSCAKIALVFLSRGNRDVWTRRCFEIPASGTLMMAPCTCELVALFKDGAEAVYYDSKEDLVQKVVYYLACDDERQQIAHAGWQRCIKDGHNELGRAKQIIHITETHNLMKN